jgi:asparagine synthase (glutamine-hydrolysing)
VCGLFGVTNDKQIDVTSAREALHTLAHRGPDQWNDFFEKNVYIGHRRLSILDVSDLGKQPMVSSDGSIIVYVNGVVYKLPELKLKEYLFFLLYLA